MDGNRSVARFRLAQLMARADDVPLSAVTSPQSIAALRIRVWPCEAQKPILSPQYVGCMTAGFSSSTITDCQRISRQPQSLLESLLSRGVVVSVSRYSMPARALSSASMHYCVTIRSCLRRHQLGNRVIRYDWLPSSSPCQEEMAHAWLSLTSPPVACRQMPAISLTLQCFESL